MDMDLKKFPVTMRKCYFEDERKLRFFRIYSKAHCKLECATNITFEKSKCVQFYMPRTSKMKVCNFTELKTVFNFMSRALEVCECLPLCNDVKYSFELERYNFPTSIIPQELLKV